MHQYVGASNWGVHAMSIEQQSDASVPLARPWNEDQWYAIQWHAINARGRIQAEVTPRQSAAALRELALKTEILGVQS